MFIPILVQYNIVFVLKGKWAIFRGGKWCVYLSSNGHSWALKVLYNLHRLILDSYFPVAQAEGIKMLKRLSHMKK